jgi:glutathione S-transferase
MLTVYEHNESVCCQKVRIVLSEKEIPHDVVNISFEKREQHTPEFEAINPKGKVPVVVHDGRVITESTVIIEYLDEAFPGPQLMPKEPYWRARRRLWARWIDDEMHIPHISTLSFNIAMTEILGYKKDVHAAGPRGAPPPFMFVGIESKEMLNSLQAYERFLKEMDVTLADNRWLAISGDCEILNCPGCGTPCQEFRTGLNASHHAKVSKNRSSRRNFRVGSNRCARTAKRLGPQSLECCRPVSTSRTPTRGEMVMPNPSVARVDAPCAAHRRNGADAARS